VRGCPNIAATQALVTVNSTAIEQSLTEFRDAFPDEPSCAAYLFRRKWPDGFVCPGCSRGRYAELKSRSYVYECLSCRLQTSITGGTAMHRSKLPLTTWFWAAGLVATHPDRVSVRLFQDLFTISAQSAQLLIRKFVKILVAFRGRPLEGLVEVSHDEIQLRAGDGPLNQSLSGRVKIAVALEVSSGRIRAEQLADDSESSIEAFVRSNVKRGELLLTNGHTSYLGLIDYEHDPSGFGKTLPRTVRLSTLTRIGSGAITACFAKKSKMLSMTSSPAEIAAPAIGNLRSIQ
jgi:hypothetical protein